MAHEYFATVSWKRGSDEPFSDNKYSRGHTWAFDGGVTVPASSSPLSVRLPFSKADAVDPEEALVAALSSCHMLTFLYLAAKDGYVVDSYEDDAVGVMTKNERGKLFVSTWRCGRASPSPAPSSRAPPSSTSCTITPTRNATSPTRC